MLSSSVDRYQSNGAPNNIGYKRRQHHIVEAITANKNGTEKVKVAA